MLTDSQIRNAKYNVNKSRTRITDINGLYVEITKTERKYWKVRTWKNGREKILTIGEYPAMSLSEARAEALKIKSAIKFGTSLASREIRTFRELAEEWLDKKIRGVRVPTHVESIEQRLENHIYPYIADERLDRLTPPDMLAILRRVEKEGKIETAYRVQNILSQVMSYGVATTEIGHNFMPDLRGALQRRKKPQHFAALTETRDIAKFVRGFDTVNSVITRHGLYFNAYTIVRPNELRKAEWEEINFHAATWIIPAERMKMRREHAVPLSRQALEILEKIKPYTGSSRYIFP